MTLRVQCLYSSYGVACIWLNSNLYIIIPIVRLR